MKLIIRCQIITGYTNHVNEPLSVVEHLDAVFLLVQPLIVLGFREFMMNSAVLVHLNGPESLKQDSRPFECLIHHTAGRDGAGKCDLPECGRDQDGCNRYAHVIRENNLQVRKRVNQQDQRIVRHISVSAALRKKSLPALSC